MHGIPLGDTSIGLSVRRLARDESAVSPLPWGRTPAVRFEVLLGLLCLSSSPLRCDTYDLSLPFGPSVSCPTYYALCGLLEGAMKPYDSSCPSRDSRPGLPG